MCRPSPRGARVNEGEESLYNVSAIHHSKTKIFWDELVVGCSSRAREEWGGISDIDVALNNIRHSLASYASNSFWGKPTLRLSES